MDGIGGPADLPAVSPPLPMRATWLLAVLLGGCSLVSSDPAEIGFGAETPTALEADLTFRGRAVTLSDDQPTTAGRLLYAEPTEVSAGPATVACTVRVAVGEGASSTVTLDLDLESGWRYGVTCAAAANDLLEGCFGCRGGTSVALDPALGLPADHRLYLAWFGDPKDATVLY